MNKPVFLLLLFTLVFTAFSQESEVFAPFISRLKAVSENNSVALTWEDSNDIEGKNVIYRHSEEITNSNIGNAEILAEIPTGTKSFIDFPPDSNEYFYAVIIKSSNGELYNYIIPFRNATSKSVFIESIASEEDLSTSVTQITAVNKDDSVIISFRSSNPTREVLLYRHNKPILSAEELLDAHLIIKLNASTNSYEDTPIAGIPNYYGVFDSGMVKINKFIFSSGENITYQPVEVPLSSGTYGTNTILPRSQPLPLLLIDTHVDEDKALSESLYITIPEEQPLSETTQNIINSILTGMPLVSIQDMAPVILDIDKASNPRGEQLALNSLLQKYFLVNNWDKTEEELNYFLRTHHSDEIEYRAHFYLAQIYYFQGRYEEAFLEFLLVKEYHYSEVEPWLNAVFRKLKNN